MIIVYDALTWFQLTHPLRKDSPDFEPNLFIIICNSQSVSFMFISFIVSFLKIKQF